jgi:hypothetical protein
MVNEVEHGKDHINAKYEAALKTTISRRRAAAWSRPHTLAEQYQLRGHSPVNDTYGFNSVSKSLCGLSRPTPRTKWRHRTVSAPMAELPDASQCPQWVEADVKPASVSRSV